MFSGKKFHFLKKLQFLRYFFDHFEKLIIFLSKILTHSSEDKNVNFKICSEIQKRRRSWI